MKKKELMTQATEQQLATLKEEYPKEQTFQRILLPRITFLSQDKTEGKGKNLQVIGEAGTFHTEKPGTDGEWEKEEIGKEIEVRIIYHRRQLRYWDAKNESYINSPIYDTDEDIVPLFQEKKEIDRGTQKELQAKYPPKEGRKTSALEDERALYVLYEGEMYQMSVKGASKWAFFSYVRKINPATVVTHITSEEKESGSVGWNQMLFTSLRGITGEEAQDTILCVHELKTAIAAEKAYYAANEPTASAKEAKDDFDKF